MAPDGYTRGAGVLTIGHSNRPLDEFLRMLSAHGVELLVDVRKMPYSRHNPQFSRDSISASLSGAGITYRHMPGLGGLRHARKDSINAAWQNASFRGYADYMQTPEFAENLHELEQLSTARTTAIMCAESLPWRCHRSLIADALTAHGVPVHHIMTAERADLHKLPDFARVAEGGVTYPGLF